MAARQVETNRLDGLGIVHGFDSQASGVFVGSGIVIPGRPEEPSRNDR
jgi:hypothetical protein